MNLGSAELVNNNGKVDLSSEHVSSIFGNLYQEAIAHKSNAEKTVVHQLDNEETNNRLIIVYRVIYISDSDLKYIVVIKAPHSDPNVQGTKVFS